MNNGLPIIPPYLPRPAGTQRTIPIAGNKGIAINCAVFEVGKGWERGGPDSSQKRRRNNGSPRKSEARTGLGGTGDRAVTMR